MLLTGFGGCFVTLSVFAATIAEFEKHNTMGTLGVGMTALFAFLLFYAAGVDAPTYVFMSEISYEIQRDGYCSWDLCILCHCLFTGYSAGCRQYWLEVLLSPSTYSFLSLLFFFTRTRPNTSSRSLLSS